MADTPIFQGHHLIEQIAFEQSPLLKSLARSGHFALHGPDNILNLPANPALATRLSISPHSGGPLSAYSDQLKFVLDDLAETSDGRALLSKETPPDVRAAAAERMGARIQNLEHTLRAGILNGDLVTNTPENMTPAEANAKVRTFFADLDGYQRTHAAQIAELKTLNPSELRWRGVTQSEANVKLALDAIDEPGNSTLSERWGGRASLGTAIQEANQGGRLPLTEHTAVRVRTAFNPEMPLAIVRPGPATAAPELAGTAGRAGAAEGAAEAAVATRGQISGARVLGAAGVAALAVDFAITGHRVAELRSEGNDAGARSAATHFVGRTAGGFGGGFLLGAGYGVVTGSWTGPGALATGLLGGVAGGFGGEYWAQYQDKKAVYTQVDRSGNEWSRDPEDANGTWSRSVRTPQPDGSYRDTTMVAGGRLVDELNYKAANDSYSLGMANLPKPQNPFKLDAGGDNTPPREPFETNRHYVRNPHNGEWNLSIHSMIDGRVPFDHSVSVSPEKAGHLELESQRIIAQNAANTPEALAARYQVAFNQYNWHEFATIEPVPEVIANAQIQTQPLRASNGEKYTQDANGQWHTPGWAYGTNPAEGSIIEELNRTRRSQHAGVQELASMADIARANPTPTEYGLRSQVVDAYRSAGIARNAEEIDDAVAAVAQDHARTVPSFGTFMLQVQKDGSLATLAGKDDERMQIVSVTTPEEIAQAHAQRATAGQEQQPAGTPPRAPTTPEPTPSASPPHTSRPATQHDADVDRHHSTALRPDGSGLLEQLRSSVTMLDEKNNKPWDQSSDRLLASAYRLAAEAGFKPGDKVDMALNEATETRAAGTTLFVTRSGPGASSDPAANRVQMPTQDALAVAPEQQYAAANRSLGAQDQERSQQLAQAQTQEQQREESRQGPRMG